MKPYKDSSNIRVFPKSVNKLELVWHQDAEDRDIEVLEGEGWQVQFDNELPFEIKKGDRIFIAEGRIHRILKGTTNLKIRINENTSSNNKQ